MDPKEKNQQVIEKQQAKLEKRSQQEQQIEDINNASSEELREMLTKRNEDYVFRLEKLLRENGLSEGDAKLKVNDFLAEIVLEQRKGHPASQIYGSPQEKVKDIINPEQKPSDSKFWQRSVDNALLYLSIFAGMFGVVGLLNQKQQQPIGIVTILSVGILFGVLMAYYNDLILLKKEERPATWKLLLGGVGIVVFILFWITLTEMPALRPANPVFPAWVVLIIAAIAFIYRRIFRAHYHLVNSPFTSAQQRAQRK